MSFSRAASGVRRVDTYARAPPTSCVTGDCRVCGVCITTQIPYSIITPQDKDKPPSLGIDVPLTLDEQKTLYEQTNKIKFWGCRAGASYIQLCHIGDGMDCFYCITSNGSINLAETKKWLDYLSAKTKELKDTFEAFCDRKISEKPYGTYGVYDTYKRDINTYPRYLCHTIDPIGIIRIQSDYSQVSYTAKRAIIENEKIITDWERNKAACELAKTELGETRQIKSHYYFVKNNVVYQKKPSPYHHFNNPEAILALRGPKQFDSIEEAEEFWVAREEAQIIAEARRRLAEEERLAAEAAKAAEREARIQAAMTRLHNAKN
jgi:hypothetical protein